MRTGNTFFQEQRHSPHNPEFDYDPAEHNSDVSHLRFKFDARPKIIIPFSVGRTGYHYLHDYKLESIPAERSNFPDVMKFAMFYELYNTAPVSRPDLFPEDALATLGQKHTDIDINRGMFRYPVIEFFESIPNGGPLKRQKQPTPLTIENLHEILPREETPPPSVFQSMLSIFKPTARDNPDVIFERLINSQKYMEALRSACNTAQIVTALEGLISNAHAAFNFHSKRKEELEKLISSRPLDNSRFMENTRIGVENLQKYMDEAQDKLHTYISWLPDKYWLYSTTIENMQFKFRFVARCIYQGNFYKALKEQNKTRCKSGFLIHAAPHLVAWQQQLNAILILLRPQISQIKYDSPEWPKEDLCSFSDPTASLNGLTEKDALFCLHEVSEIFHNINPEMATWFDEHTLAPVSAMVSERRELRLVAMINHGFEKYLDREDREELCNRSALPGLRK